MINFPHYCEQYIHYIRNNCIQQSVLINFGIPLAFTCQSEPQLSLRFHSRPVLNQSCQVPDSLTSLYIPPSHFIPRRFLKRFTPLIFASVTPSNRVRQKGNPNRNGTHTTTPIQCQHFLCPAYSAIENKSWLQSSLGERRSTRRHSTTTKLSRSSTPSQQIMSILDSTKSVQNSN